MIKEIRQCLILIRMYFNSPVQCQLRIPWHQMQPVYLLLFAGTCQVCRVCGVWSWGSGGPVGGVLSFFRFCLHHQVATACCHVPNEARGLWRISHFSVAWLGNLGLCEEEKLPSCAPFDRHLSKIHCSLHVGWMISANVITNIITTTSTATATALTGKWHVLFFHTCCVRNVEVKINESYEKKRLFTGFLKCDASVKTLIQRCSFQRKTKTLEMF